MTRRVCRWVRCTETFEANTRGRPKLYCSSACRFADRAARRGDVELTAHDDAGEVLDVEIVADPLDPHAWADAHALVAGAIAGEPASGSWATTLERPIAPGAAIIAPGLRSARQAAG